MQKSRTGDQYRESDSSRDMENISSLTTGSIIVKRTSPKNNSWDKSLFSTNIQLQDTVKPNDSNVILQSDEFQDQNDRDADIELQVSDNTMLITNEIDTIPFVAYKEHCISYEEISCSSTSSLINFEAPMMDDYLTDSNTVDDYYSGGIIVTELYKLVYHCIL